jgi:hypothetical protein
MGDINEPSGNGKPKHRPSWFRWNFDDFIAETDHLGPNEFTAAARTMAAMSRTDDYTLADDPKELARIARGRSGARFRWDRLNTAALETVLTFKDGRVSCPWLGRTWAQAGLALGRKWAEATDKPLKDNGTTTTNRECRKHNKENATPPARAGAVAGREEAYQGEPVEEPRTPEKQAQADKKWAEWNALKKREAVQKNLGITEGNIAPYMEVSDEDDAGGCTDDASGTAA